jgi:hypothetical protein
MAGAGARGNQTEGFKMTTHPLSARINPLVWLLLQAVAIVASILLAFAIDAWWNQRKETVEKNIMLQSIKAEMLLDQQSMKQDRVYRQAAMESTISLLSAMAAGRYEDAEKSIDRRLGDLTWFSGMRFSTAAVESLLSSGRVAAIEDDRLRLYLVRWPNAVEAWSKVQGQDYETLMEVTTPFLGRNSSLAQITNEAYRYGRPGDGWGVDPKRVVPVSVVADHAPLLRNKEFAGVLVRKMWNDGDVLFGYDDIVKEMDEVIRRIDQELKSTS